MRETAKPLFRVEVYTAIFKRRLNRFLVQAINQNGPLSLHLNNTGRLNDLLWDGVKILYRPIEARKCVGRVVGVILNGQAALIDTALQARAFEEAFSKGLVSWLHGYKLVSKDVLIRGHRIDYLFKSGYGRLYLELKSAVMLGRNGAAMYPDTVSERGRKHIRLLTSIASKSNAAIVFMAAHPKAKFFTPYDEGDPQIRILLLEAVRRGVMARAVKLYMRVDGMVIWITSNLPVVLSTGQQ